jgi:NADPH:quinone reductase-like Zn-dependent oxidoreductase
MPVILGWDVSGIIVAVGRRATKFKIGDAVFSRPDIKRNGTYAEFIAVRETEIALKPLTISHMESATLPLAGITAWQALFKVLKLKAGDRILIHGGAGGVGTLAVQLAKAHGAHVITTTSAKNRNLLESLGADEVIDYHTVPFSEAVKNVDSVFDTIGGETQNASWKTLKPGGNMVSIVSSPSKEKAKELGMHGEFLFIEPDAEVLAQLALFVDTGRLRPIIGGEYSLKDTAKAHLLSQKGHVVGKIVLHVGQP